MKRNKSILDFVKRSKKETNDSTSTLNSATAGQYSQSDPVIGQVLSKTSNNQEKTHDLSSGPLDLPTQPIINFPHTNGRKFCQRYYNIHQWIEYSKTEDSVYCFSCRHFSSSLVRSGETYGNRTFIDKGFKKWRDATALFQQHEKSDRHKFSIKAWIELKSRSSNETAVASLLDSERTSEITENRRHVRILLKVVSFLTRQGLAFRGHVESEESENKGNFLEMIETLCEDDPKLKERMSRRYGHYTSPEYQNDLISVFSSRVKNNIIHKVKESNFFSIMADETKDLSKSEQLAILVRYLDSKDFKIKERAIGLIHMKNCNAESIAKTILSLLAELGLDVKNCVGQCYDGANVMSGWASGVQTRIKDKAPQATYFHCHAHRLNLVLVHTLGSVEEAKSFFSTVQTIYCFISNSSPRHETFLETQKKLKLPILSLEKFIPTRWFYWFRAVSKILKTFQAILVVLETDTHRAESIGIRAQMAQQSFIFLLYAMELILGITYSLSEQLQSVDLDLLAVSRLIKSTKIELTKIRSDESYENVLGKAKSLASICGIEWIDNKRKRSVASWLADSVVTSSVGQTEKNLKSIYFNVIDIIVHEFDRRFSDNHDIMEATRAFDRKGDTFLDGEVLKPFLNKYHGLLNPNLLDQQLPLAKNYLNQANSTTPSEFLEDLQKLPVAYSEVISLLKIFLTLPITTASNERFFSVLKRVKNYLRTKTTDERLASLMILSVEREEVKKISLDELIDDFAKLRQRRYPLMQ